MIFVRMTDCDDEVAISIDVVQKIGYVTPLHITGRRPHRATIGNQHIVGSGTLNDMTTSGTDVQNMNSYLIVVDGRIR